MAEDAEEIGFENVDRVVERHRFSAPTPEWRIS
jgi:hypothetical protein